MPGPSTNNVANNSPIVVGTTNQITSTYSGSPSTTATLAFASTIINPTQPLFSAYLSTNQTTATGDGTAYPIVYDTVTVNQASAYNASTGFFTAPITGVYLLITLNAFTNGNTITTHQTLFSGSAISYQASYSTTTIGAPNTLARGGSAILAMTAGDTVQVIMTANGSSKTTTVVGSGSPVQTYFCGYLMP